MRPIQIRENIEAAGSQPFIIRMSDGTALLVPHTDQVIIGPRGRQLAFFARNGALKLIDTTHITSIEFTPSKSKAA